MSLLLESIRIENGRVMNIEYHRERMERSVKRLGLGLSQAFRGSFIPECSIPPAGVYKCRVLYNMEIVSCEVTPYTQRKIKSLKPVTVLRKPDYELKYADRSVIDELFASRGDCDDIMIVAGGVVTDSSYCNLAFERNGRWFTPSSPLLRGTMRQFLIDRGVIYEEEILYSDLSLFSRLTMFNAMIPWERSHILEVKNFQKE
jgi:4-amino-4-deoxychorismate lyase